MGPVERKMEEEITFLCDVGMQETVCFKLGVPRLVWYVLHNGRMIYTSGFSTSSAAVWRRRK